MAMILLLAAPAAGVSAARVGDIAAAAREPAVPPPRDVVFDALDPAAATISATAAANRYPINDGSGATIAIAVTPACQASCNAAEPQRIADFIGTLIHGFEIDLLTVQLDTPSQLEFDCGFGAQACYYSSQNKMVINGNDSLGPDWASREFVIAHEYGHHVAQHRDNPVPFPSPIEWGTARWSSYEHVCQRRRTGSLFPGYAGAHYYEDPGEAFAEAFARNRFPDAGVTWRWPAFLKPNAAAFEAIREDTLDPWLGRNSFRLAGRLPPRNGGAVVESFRTPLDGTVSLRPSGLGRHRYELSLRSPAGRVLRTSRHGLNPRHQLDFTVCGQSRLRVAIRSTRRSGGPFGLLIQRP